jgi:hypothetical protein
LPAVIVGLGLPWSILPVTEPNAISYGNSFSRSNDAVIRVYDDAGNVIETHEHANFKE